MPDKQRPQKKHWWLRFKQDLRVLKRLFPWRVAGIMFFGIAFAAYLFQYTYNRWESPSITYVKAIYAVINMSLFQLSYADMPSSPHLDIFFVLAPLIGLPLFLLFGANILNVIRVFFVREERGQAWQKTLVSTISSPVVICGLGRVGYRVAKQLIDLDEPVVGIDITTSALTDEILEQDIPLILGDVRKEDILEQAGVDRAPTVLVCTNKDLVNIETAFRVRELNPDARIILRLFEDEIAEEIQASFNVADIISRSALAAQAFAYAAMGIEVLETFELDDKDYLLAKVPLNNRSPLLGQELQIVQNEKDVAIVCLYRDKKLIIEPPGDAILHTNDVLFAFTEARRLISLTENDTHNPGTRHKKPYPIIVCGVGHTGYRVIKALLAMGRPVVALQDEPNRLSEQLQSEDLTFFFGDFRLPIVLERAGIDKAAALIACTDNDMVNFETALRARELNPDLRIVMRIFEEALGERLKQIFNIDAVYSTSAIAAPAFVSSALRIHLAQPVNVEETQYLIAQLKVGAVSGLIGASIEALIREEDLTILLNTHGHQICVPPEPSINLSPGDRIVVLATPKKLRDLARRNRQLWEL